MFRVLMGVDTTTLSNAEVVFSQLKIGENITLQTTSGNYTIKTIANPDNSSKGYIGIRAMQQEFVNQQCCKNCWYPKFHGLFIHFSSYFSGFSS